MEWQDQGLRLEQITGFPQEEGSSFVIHLERPASFALNVHIPYWATTGVGVKINGREEKVSVKPSSYLVLHRLWKDGDKVEIALPMSLHTWPMPDDPELRAIMYGPVVLAGITEANESDTFYEVPAGKDFPDADRVANYDFFIGDVNPIFRRFENWFWSN